MIWREFIGHHSFADTSKLNLFAIKSVLSNKFSPIFVFEVTIIELE